MLGGMFKVKEVDRCLHAPSICECVHGFFRRNVYHYSSHDMLAFLTAALLTGRDDLFSAFESDLSDPCYIWILWHALLGNLGYLRVKAHRILFLIRPIYHAWPFVAIFFCFSIFG